MGCCSQAKGGREGRTGEVAELQDLLGRTDGAKFHCAHQILSSAEFCRGVEVGALGRGGEVGHAQPRQELQTDHSVTRVAAFQTGQSCKVSPPPNNHTEAEG